MKKPQGAELSDAAGEKRDAPVREGPPQPYPGKKARQGRIVLDSPERRALFLGGLIGLAIVALILMLIGA